MYYIIARLYIVPGMTDQFREYERQALGIFRRHGGELVAAFRPDGRLPDSPDEIHILRIESVDQFKRFSADHDLMRLVELRSQVIAKTEIETSTQPFGY